jgi:hypothetical protein
MLFICTKLRKCKGNNKAVWDERGISSYGQGHTPLPKPRYNKNQFDVSPMNVDF